jgi:phage terminase large subunit-like protein
MSWTEEDSAMASDTDRAGNGAGDGAAAPKRVTLQRVEHFTPDERAARGKATRAEPISALYAQGRVSHVGSFPALEDQQCTWVPGETSPDRMDALVWALTDLLDPARKIARVL